MGSRIKKAVIPSAGLGTRLLPLTKAVPKELLPVGRFPMIHWCVVEAALSGIEEVIIVIRSGKEAIKSYFMDDIDASVSKTTPFNEPGRLRDMMGFRFVYQNRPRGPGDALLEAKSAIGDRPFALMYPDDVFPGKTPALRQLIDVFEETGEMVTGLIRVPAEEEHTFANCGGVDVYPIDGDIFRITSLHDKGPGHFAVKEQGEVRWTGRHILTPEFLEHLKRTDDGGDELDDVAAFQSLIGKAGMLGKLIDGEVFDVGNLDGYLRANVRLAGDRGRDYLSMK